MYIYITRAACTDIPDALSRPVSIVYCSREVFQGISSIGTELLYLGSSWSYYFCEGAHRSISFMSSSLLHQQCHACLIRLTLLVFVIGGRWPYSWCFVGCGRSISFLIFLIIFKYIWAFWFYYRYLLLYFFLLSKHSQTHTSRSIWIAPFSFTIYM